VTYGRIIESNRTLCEFGKINNASPYPPDMRGHDGADELTLQAINEGVSAEDILTKRLFPA
jgi:hypothetical protein